MKPFLLLALLYVLPLTSCVGPGHRLRVAEARLKEAQAEAAELELKRAKEAIANDDADDKERREASATLTYLQITFSGASSKEQFRRFEKMAKDYEGTEAAADAAKAAANLRVRR